MDLPPSCLRVPSIKSLFLCVCIFSCASSVHPHLLTVPVSRTGATVKVGLSTPHSQSGSVARSRVVGRSRRPVSTVRTYVGRRVFRDVCKVHPCPSPVYTQVRGSFGTSVKLHPCPSPVHTQTTAGLLSLRYVPYPSLRSDRSLPGVGRVTRDDGSRYGGPTRD